MLYQTALDELSAGINLIDIGASGNLDRKWKPIESMLNLVAFDPNEEECARLSAQPTRFRSAMYLPYAVGGHTGDATLYRTKSMYCYSLLEPNSPWLERFTFRDLFEVEGTESIPVRRFGDIQELSGLDVDVIKTDSQGLDLQILSNADDFLDRAFYVETETGFVQNCVGETTYAQIDEFMRSHDFMLFDLGTHHRIPRRNRLARHPSGREQLLWCESVWLKDYVSMSARGESLELDRTKAIKALVLCSLQECLDYGYELACLFHEMELITEKELQSLGRPIAWRLGNGSFGRIPVSAYGYMLRLLPARMRKTLADESDRVLHQPDLLKATIGRVRKQPA